MSTGSEGQACYGFTRDVERFQAGKVLHAFQRLDGSGAGRGDGFNEGSFVTVDLAVAGGVELGDQQRFQHFVGNVDHFGAVVIGHIAAVEIAQTAAVAHHVGHRVVLGLGHNGARAVAAKGVGAVVHDGKEIVGSDANRTFVFVEVVLVVGADVVESNGDVVVAVGSTLFVPETECVGDLVHDGVVHPPVGDAQGLLTADHAHGRVVAVAADYVNVVGGGFIVGHFNKSNLSHGGPVGAGGAEALAVVFRDVRSETVGHFAVGPTVGVKTFRLQLPGGENHIVDHHLTGAEHVTVLLKLFNLLGRERSPVPLEASRSQRDHQNGEEQYKCNTHRDSLKTCSVCGRPKPQSGMQKCRQKAAAGRVERWIQK